MRRAALAQLCSSMYDSPLLLNSQLTRVELEALLKNTQKMMLIYSEKATKVCEISTNYLSYVLPVKWLVEISQNFVAFLEYMNFKVTNQQMLSCEVGGNHQEQGNP